MRWVKVAVLVDFEVTVQPLLKAIASMLLPHRQEFYQRLIEIARRHKIMNPEKMRGEYGKLLYLLQDSVSPTIQSQMGVSFVAGISSGQLTG